MLEKLVENLKKLAENKINFDPAQYNDEVAMQTEWIPLKRGGANFCTHEFVEIDYNRVGFKASKGAKILYLAFITIGLAIGIGFPVANFINNEFQIDIFAFMPIVFGLIFFTIGTITFRFGTKPIIFDRAKGLFWKGRKEPNNYSDNSTLKNFAYLDDIHALQLISEYCRSDKSSYYSYELNLVLENGQRINVVDHGNKVKLRTDA
ncbi:MAG: hypothetical protein JXR63_07865, partial [Spirochaetales bacterium]|nr:hypothetical protein [Spirochaetales bacterium]